MNKLNIECLMKLVDQLTYDDYIKFKKLMQLKIFVVHDSRIYDKKLKRSKKYYIEAENRNDLFDKMLLLKIPEYNYGGLMFIPYDKKDNNVINILKYIYDPTGSIIKCYLCDSTKCDHVINKISYLPRSNLNQDQIKKIINAMIDDKSLNIYRKNLGHKKYFKLK